MSPVRTGASSSTAAGRASCTSWRAAGWFCAMLPAASPPQAVPVAVSFARAARPLRATHRRQRRRGPGSIFSDRSIYRGRGPAAIGAGFERAFRVGPAVDQELDGGRMSLVRGPHQRRRPTQGFLRVDLRAAVEQHLHRRHVARARRHHQRRLSPRQRLVRIRARLQQALDDGGVAIQAGQRERREALRGWRPSDWRPPGATGPSVATSARYTAQ